jgi:DNA replication and repair protein RecF
MHITTVAIKDFRNFTALRRDFSAGVNIFYGRNGSGKTNLLEAIFNLCLGRSQRGAADSLMLRSGCDVYRLAGVIAHDDTERQLAVAYQSRGRKKVTIDGVVEKIAALYESFSAVSAGPEDSAILSGPPATRRTFIDIYLSQLSGRYLAELSDYQKVLAHKNAALKQDMDCSAFEPLLVSHGSKIMLERRELIRSLQKVACRHYQEISEGEEMNISYDPSVRLTDAKESAADIEQAFESKLEHYAEQERIMQTAMVGPHRDDVRFDINHYPARTHGSQGQWRTGAISLKLAIYELLKGKRGSAPLLLLDEVFAELDRGRAEGLIESFSGFTQLFLTTAVDPPERLRSSGCCYAIDNGQIEEIS